MTKRRVAKIELTPEEVAELLNVSEQYEGEPIRDIAVRASFALPPEPPARPVRPALKKVLAENARLNREIERMRMTHANEIRHLHDTLEMSKRTRTIVPVPVKSMKATP